MEDLYRINQEVRVSERARLVLHELLARRSLGRAGALSPDFGVARPLPAKCSIKEDTHILEMLVDIAVACKRCHWNSPSARIRSRNVRWDLISGERPDLDTLAGHFSGHNGASLSIEGGSETLCARVLDLAAGVLALFRVIHIAIWCRLRPRKASLLDTAACIRVEGHAVIGSIVHALENVDFSVRRPSA